MSSFTHLVRFPFTASLLAACIVSAGCDAEPGDDDEHDVLRGDLGDAAHDDHDDDDDGRDDDRDDDRDSDGDDPGPVADVPAHPCGNGVIEADEECDDGALNSPQRECTTACRANACNLDAAGFCEHHWPAADVDLHPCDVEVHGVCID